MEQNAIMKAYVRRTKGLRQERVDAALATLHCRPTHVPRDV